MVDRVWMDDNERARCGGLAAPVRRVVRPRSLCGLVTEVSAGCERFTRPVCELVVPDGRTRIVFDLGTEPGAMVEGPTTRPTTLVLSGAIDHVTVAVAPGAVQSVLGVPGAAVRDLRVPLGELWPDAQRWLDAIAFAAPPDCRVEAVVGLLRERVRDVGAGPDELVAAAVHAAGSVPGVNRVSSLAAGVGLGERRLEERFRTSVGVTPKELLRMQRLRWFWRELGQADPADRSAAAAAATAGFADQAHAARDVRALTSHTVSELVKLGFVQDLGQPHVLPLGDDSETM